MTIISKGGSGRLRYFRGAVLGLVLALVALLWSGGAEASDILRYSCNGAAFSSSPYKEAQRCSQQSGKTTINLSLLGGDEYGYTFQWRYQYYQQTVDSYISVSYYCGNSSVSLAYSNSCRQNRCETDSTQPDRCDWDLEKDICADDTLVEIGVQCVGSCVEDETRNPISGICEPSACPSGEELVGGQCVEKQCPVGEWLNQSTGQCELAQCEHPEVWNAQTQQCDPPACAEGESYNYTTRQCEPQANACEVYAGSTQGLVGPVNAGVSVPSTMCVDGCSMTLEQRFTDLPDSMKSKYPDWERYEAAGAEWPHWVWPDSDVQSCNTGTQGPEFQFPDPTCPAGSQWDTAINDCVIIVDTVPGDDGGEDEGGGDTGGGDTGGGDTGGGGDDDDNSGPEGDGGQDPGGEDAGGDDDTPGGDGDAPGDGEVPDTDPGGDGSGEDDPGGEGGAEEPEGPNDGEPGGEDGGGNLGGEEGPGPVQEPPGDGEGDEEVDCDPATETCEEEGQRCTTVAECFGDSVGINVGHLYERRYPGGWESLRDKYAEQLAQTGGIGSWIAWASAHATASDRCPQMPPVNFGRLGVYQIRIPCTVYDLLLTAVLALTAFASWNILFGRKGAD